MWTWFVPQNLYSWDFWKTWFLQTWLNVKVMVVLIVFLFYAWCFICFMTVWLDDVFVMFDFVKGLLLGFVYIMFFSRVLEGKSEICFWFLNICTCSCQQTTDIRKLSMWLWGKTGFVALLPPKTLFGASNSYLLPQWYCSLQEKKYRSIMKKTKRQHKYKQIQN